uniref:Heat shock transcription factor 1 n=1 Tax=Poecilia latipinna TaxID=48699 RepID=A0A3B3TL35_9TELE
MEFLGGPGAVVVSGGNVPAFLTKLWTLVEDPETDPLICWSPSGTSFHVFDQCRFSKEVLPKFFKHNNMASFIRQLNMYGFRKVVHIEQGGLVKPEKDDTEFQHPFFVKGQEHLLEHIKRKVTNVSKEMKISTDEVNKILSDVQLMKGKQETIDSRIIAMKHENEALWREVASLRQKHAQQQKVVNKLIHFLVSLVQTNRIIGVKRKIPLMLNDSSSAHSMPKYSRPLTLEHIQVIHLILGRSHRLDRPGVRTNETSLLFQPVHADVRKTFYVCRENHSTFIKEEPSSPEVEECPVLEVEQDSLPANVDTPLSPTTFINSILQEETPLPCELSDHVDSIDNGLENLQSILNAQTFTFDPSPLMEFFSSSISSGDFDIESLDNVSEHRFSSLAPPCCCHGVCSDLSALICAGKQLVQYTATPLHLTEPVVLGEGDTDLPSLLEYETEPLFSSEAAGDDPPDVLLSPSQLDSNL